MIVSKENIQTLIPQGPPFVMIDTLVQSGEASTSASLVVRADNIFVEEGLFREAGIVEHIAQTAAARSGYEMQQCNAPLRTGYIGAVKNLEIFSLPQIGDELVTEIKIENRIFDITMISGKTHSNGKLVASCEMKIFINKLNNSVS